MVLNKALAETLMAELTGLASGINGVAGLVETVEPEAKRERMRRGIANLLSALDTDLISPLICEYPELNPDQRCSAD